MKISVCCPSLKRPEVETLRYLPFCRVYVSPEDAREYRKANPSADIVECDRGIQGNISRVRNHIMDREFSGGADAVIMVDDDMKKIGYFEEKKTRKLLPGKEVMGFLEKYTLQAREIGAYLWGVNVNFDAQSYREYSPFSTVSFIGGPFQGVLRGTELRYDERLPLKEDYDFTLQNLNRYRVVFRVNKFYYVVKQSVQPGGCALIRNIEREREQFDLLVRKWGRGIVHADTNDRNHKTTKERGNTFDYNPVIRSPIAGI